MGESCNLFGLAEMSISPAVHSSVKKTEESIVPKKTINMPSDSVEWWSNIASILAVVGLVLGGLVALVGIAGWGFSWKAGKLKDAAFNAFKIESKRATAEADAKAAEANKIAAQANERAALLEKEAAAARLETEQIKEKLAATAKLAEPVKLKVLSAFRNTEAPGLCTTVTLQASKNQALGNLQFTVTIIGDSPGTITKLFPSLKGGAFQSGAQSFKKSIDGKSAILSYVPMSAMIAVFDITVTEPMTVRITGNRMDGYTDIRIE